MTTAFFGHRDTPYTIKSDLKQVISNLIEKENIKHFLVGNEGDFDHLVQEVLKELSAKDATIRYSVVLAYLPKKTTSLSMEQTIYPEGLETIPQRFAISKRNAWMLEKADIIIVYVTTSFGNSFQLMNRARKKSHQYG